MHITFLGAGGVRGGLDEGESFIFYSRKLPNLFLLNTLANARPKESFKSLKQRILWHLSKSTT